MDFFGISSIIKWFMGCCSSCVFGAVSSILSFRYIGADWNLGLIFIILYRNQYSYSWMLSTCIRVYKSRIEIYLPNRKLVSGSIAGFSGLNVWVLRIILIVPVASVLGIFLYIAFTVDPQYHVWRNEVITIVLIDSVLIFFYTSFL